MPSNMMTPQGGSQQTYGEQSSQDVMASSESPETFRRRTAPVLGQPEAMPTSLGRILALLNGGGQ